MQSQSIQDPRQAFSRPPFPKQEQPAPGSERKLNPSPDYGLETYKGHGRLRDRAALITGGDSGIGRAVALCFAREGADVVIGYLEETEDAKETEEAVQQAGRRCVRVAADISTNEGCDALVQAAIKAFGRIDVLVNNAAYQGKAVSSILDLDDDRVDLTFRTNITSMFKLTRRCLPHMKPGASIINVASIQAYDPSSPILDYASTKGAIVAYTKGLAQELLPKHGIRVNAVAPGPVWTPLVAASFPEQKVARFGEQSPMGRPAQPVEVATAFVFLASEEGRYVNGEVLGVTGGMLLG